MLLPDQDDHVQMASSPAPLFEESLLTDCFADDAAAVRELLELFVVEAAATVAQLASAVAARDVNAVRRLAHGLAGSAATIGALQLADASKRLDESARADRLARGKELQAELQRSFESTRAALA